jgi:hypothetical protein
MKKVFLVLLSVLLTASFVFAEQTLDELKADIAKMEKKIKSLEKRVGKTERHVATDRVSMGVELTTAWHSYEYRNALQMPDMAQDMMVQYLQDSLYSGGQESWNKRDIMADMANQNVNQMFNQMGMTVPYKPYNDFQYSDGWNDTFVSTYMNDFQQVMSTPEVANMIGQQWMSLDQATQAQYIQGAIDDFDNAFKQNGNPNGTGLTVGAYVAWKQGQYTPSNPQEQMMFENLDQMVMGGFGMDMVGRMVGDRTMTAQEAKAFKTMFKNMKPKEYNTSNSSIFTNRLRLRLKAKVNSHLSFTGRLVMYKTWGDSSNVRWFDGTFNSMHLDGNSAAIPTDDSLRVERAYFVYSNNLGDVHWHISFGRRPSTNGFGMENKNYSPLGGSPAGHIIQWNFDGASLGFNLEEVIGIEGFNVKVCYGLGYEGGWGTLNSMDDSKDVNDVNMLGAIIKFFDNEDYKIVYNWAHAFGVTDGFVGQVAMPFYISGADFDGDGQFDEYTFTPNYGAYMSRFEPTNELGDVDLHSLIVEGNTADWSWFASVAYSIADPNDQSKNPMFQFMEMDGLLCSPQNGDCGHKDGYSVWAGIMTPELPFTGGKLGYEYNYGSKYWFNFTAGEDSITGSKLATRGNVHEIYYHQPIVGSRLFATIGYRYSDYDYTGSGSPLGRPVKISEANAFNTMMPVKNIVSDFYVTATFRY